MWGEEEEERTRDVEDNVKQQKYSNIKCHTFIITYIYIYI